ncbi:hypothetical protein CEP51_015523 [Fusarium floridanum]|uniref:Expansin-like EG45 domain-containing protein n=1 Tax=Fusarium floridanum TaxID=1325733 RepID=A0A428P8B6_9HYPO|nr:hypothetical protein CEP51_015523 [Fusarium floridanum]RSL67014.1 hypothetical protein CEP53_003147 [Fusarium sp. AF-6]
MKFLIPILLAAPAVMGRACKVRHSHSSQPTLEAPVNTQPATIEVPDNNNGAIIVSTTAVPEAVVSQPAVVEQPSSDEEDSSPVVSDTTPKTTLVTSVAPTTPSASSVPETDSGSDSDSGTSEDLGGEAKTGSSTFYGGNLSGGNCMFTTYTLPSGIYGTAFSGAVWNNAASCGACIEVTGPSGTITAMIVDQCPECEEGHLDLFPDAFTAVGGTDGIVETSYKFVTCGITTPLYLHNKEGTSQHWFSIQVVNSNEPVSKLEVSTDGGSTWQETERKDYNFFENSAGFGVDSVDVKITSKTGKTVTVSGVGVEAGAKYEADSNF